MYTVKFCKLSGMGYIPTKAHDSDAGYDLYSPIRQTIEAHKSAIIQTDIAWETSSPRLYMQVKSRSGLAFKHGIEASNAGVIDSAYRNSIGVKLYNNSNEDYTVEIGDRIAQGIILELPEVQVEVVENVSTSERNGGLGSTGR